MFLTVPFVILKICEQPKCSEIINVFIMCPLNQVIIITDLVFEECLRLCEKILTIKDSVL